MLQQAGTQKEKREDNKKKEQRNTYQHKQRRKCKPLYSANSIIYYDETKMFSFCAYVLIFYLYIKKKKKKKTKARIPAVRN